MVRVVCPKCRKETRWKLLEVVSAVRREYRILCLECNSNFIVTGSQKKEFEEVAAPPMPKGEEGK